MWQESFQKLLFTFLFFLLFAVSIVCSFLGNKRRQFHEQKFSQFGEIAKSLHFPDISFFRLKNVQDLQGIKFLGLQCRKYLLFLVSIFIKQFLFKKLGKNEKFGSINFPVLKYFKLLWKMCFEKLHIRKLQQKEWKTAIMVKLLFVKASAFNFFGPFDPGPNF